MKLKWGVCAGAEGLQGLEEAQMRRSQAEEAKLELAKKIEGLRRTPSVRKEPVSFLEASALPMRLCGVQRICSPAAFLLPCHLNCAACGRKCAQVKHPD